eukprot:g46059.t1
MNVRFEMKIAQSKVKELVIDFRKQCGGHAPVCINDAEVEMVKNYKFSRVNITNNPFRSIHIDTTIKKPHYFLRSEKYRQTSACSCPTELISNYRDSIFSLLVQELPTYVRDTTHTVHLLQNFQFPGPQHLIFTMDV